MIPRRYFWLFDLACLAAAFAAAHPLARLAQSLLIATGLLHSPNLRFLSPPRVPETFPTLLEYIWIALTAIPVTLLVTDALGGHRPIPDQRPARIVLNGLAAQLVSLGVLTSAFFVLRTPGFSRLFVFSYLFLNVIILAGYRLLARAAYLRSLRRGSASRDIALIGDRSSIEKVLALFANRIAGRELRIAGYLSVEPDSQPPRFPGEQPVPHLGPAGNLADVLVNTAIEHVVAVIPTAGAHWLDQAIADCDYFLIHLHLVPAPLLTRNLQDLRHSNSDPLHLPALVLTPDSHRHDALFEKRLLDVIVSSSLLVLLSPLFLLAAILIKITTPRLPIFYRWRVVGYKGKRFTGYKFTTMYEDADLRKQELSARNEMSGPVFKIRNDPRVTPLGYWLRKFSINELPQLWSVLKGDMSLVGPRPAFPHELAGYETWHKRKLSVRPGITCLWQVRGRNLINNFDDWVRLDLEYIRDRSIGLDLRILARTLWVVMKGTGT